MSERKPLAGRRVLVTRARHQAGQLSAELAKLGAEMIEIPAIEVVPPESFEELDRALKHPGRYDWLVVTSTNAVRAMRDRFTQLEVSAEGLRGWEVAAVGATSARALAEWGLQPSITPKEYVAESLVEAIGDRVRGKRVLIVRAATARDVIPDALKALGAEIVVAEAYRTVIPEGSVERVAELFEGASPDAATFTSSSTVSNFFHLLHSAGFKDRPPGMRAVSIGPITSQTLREHGWEPAAEADPHDIPGLVAATVRTLA